MDFNESIVHALYIRMEEAGDEGTLLDAALMESVEYDTEFCILRDTLAALPDRDMAERAALAARRLCDMHTHYFYRVGLQDGVKLTAADFPIGVVAKIA